MKDNYLLKSESAKRLYDEFARELPIIDFHNHLSLSDIRNDRKYESLYELWLECDPYKHRLMRICGIDEHFITGGASPYEKVEKFFEIFPLTAGNPVYDWSRMELSRIFGIEELPTRENARYVYDKVNEMLASSEYSNNAILSRFNIEYQSPVVSLLDDLSLFNTRGVAPSLRADNLLMPDSSFISGLSAETKIKITDRESYVKAISIILDRLDRLGCRFADHSLDDGFFERDTNGECSELLTRLGAEYRRRGWTLLLHLGAKRDTSSRLRKIAGPAGGYAMAGNSFDISALAGLLNKMECIDGLADTVLFPINMNDMAPVAIMQGSFSEDGHPSKVSLGPAWWWCDHAMGIERALDNISSFGVVSELIGMTTDSRSILSFVRHDYFRRILCAWLDRKNLEGEWELPFDIQGEIINKICYKNAKRKILGE